MKMNTHEYETGLPKNEIDTPALLLDLEAVEHNIQKMAVFCQAAGVHLRPHAKIYKATPLFAWMQLRAGANGITVSKLAEAEVLASSGIQDILIANQVVGERKVQRLVHLAAYTRVITAIDSIENAAMISRTAQSVGTQVGVLVEVNIGNNRCGVEPFEATLAFVQEVLALPNLRFRGLMGYDGHLAFVKDELERYQRSQECYQILVDTAACLVKTGIPVEIVSGGGSATYQSAARVKGITEIQAGTYIFNDTTYAMNGLSEFECALYLLATVISRPKWAAAEDVAILDVGRKSLDIMEGFPDVKSIQGEIFSMPQEHSRLRFTGAKPYLQIGDKVELWVKDSNGTINLFDHLYAIRNDRVETVIEIAGRGKVT
jgi:D-serine deaminase-like pyridoxal phosphate-dependent protein